MDSKAIKQEFASQYTSNESTRATVLNVLARAEAFESKFGHDLCQFTKDELVEYMNSALAVRNYSKQTKHIIIREYLKWCKDHGYGNAIYGLPDANVTGLDKLKMQTVSGPKELKQVLDEVFARPEDITYDNVYRLWLWFAFCGIPEDVTALIRTEDVNLDENTVSVNNETYVLPDEAKDELRNVTILRSFRYIHPLYRNETECFRERVESDQLLRGVRGELSLPTIKGHISRVFTNAYANRETQKKTNYTKLGLSGLFYRMWCYEKKTNESPLFLARQYDNVEERFKDKGSSEKEWIWNRKAKNYMSDYENWKKVNELD